MQRYGIIGLILAAGMTQPIQAAMNAKLRDAVTSPALAGLISFAIGALALAGLAASGLLGSNKLSGAADVPWWAWLGGISGVFSVVTALDAVRQTSAAIAIAASVFGQALASLLIDHFGWLDVKQIPIGPWRIGGAALIFVGFLLMNRK